MNSKYVHMLILALSATRESLTFKKTTFRNYVILRNCGTIKLQSSQFGSMLNLMSQSNSIYQLPYLRYYVLKFKFRKIEFLENPPVTWPHFFYFWFVFYCESDDIIEISKFKFFRIHRNKVWNQPLSPLTHQHKQFSKSVAIVYLAGMYYFRLMKLPKNV